MNEKCHFCEGTGKAIQHCEDCPSRCQNCDGSGRYINAMQTVTISIGRNVGEHGTLTSYEWDTFTARLDGLVAERCAELFVHSRGVGEGGWGQEENYTVVATIFPSSLRTLPSALGRLAHEFKQECIALTVGETTLVDATP